MGLMAADLEKHRAKFASSSSFKNLHVPDRTEEEHKEAALSSLEMFLAMHAGFAPTLDKTASERQFYQLYSSHRTVEEQYRSCVKEGLRPEANKILDKYAGWAYLKGQPGEPGDLHPLPAPDEK